MPDPWVHAFNNYTRFEFFLWDMVEAVKPVVNVCHELTAIKDTVHSHFHFQMYPKWISSCVQN